MFLYVWVSFLDLLISFLQIHATKIKDNSFWVKVKEEKLEKDDYLDLVSEMFASKPAKVIGGADATSGTGAPEKPKKGSELKVLDGKSAQNICMYSCNIF